RLARALAADTSGKPLDLTHPFHSYPARFHPLVCRSLFADLFASGGRRRTLLDPFVGSGTTLIEGMLHGCATFGSDINPLALDLSWLKTSRFASSFLARAHAAVTQIAEHSLARVKQRRRSHISGLELDEPAHYEPHIFRELVGLWEEIQKAPDPTIRKV